MHLRGGIAMADSHGCKIVDGKCESGPDIGHFVKCYRCELNPHMRTVCVEIPFADYQLVLDHCKIDGFDPNEALSRIVRSGVAKLRMISA